MNFIMEFEPAVRLGSFLGIFALMAAWEILAPRRRLAVSKSLRWLSNIGLVVLNTLALRVILPGAAVGMALLANTHGWGLLNSLALPAWVSVVLAVMALDLAIYLQRVMFHAVPALWRLHMVHHADLDFDVTTGARFHTIEIILSMGIKMGVVAALGPPAVAVVLFEILLNATAMFNHGNVRLPVTLDRYLRLLVVTPDMHRVHHSVVPRETNSNFGFNLPWWDRLFGTYRAQPAAGHEGMTIGLSQFRDVQVTRLHWMLLLPFVGTVGNYPIGERGERRNER
jgi:sterol desaturase/sphingolipid hydroxylase (fatty acid hydroxylase superfamily)